MAGVRRKKKSKVVQPVDINFRRSHDVLRSLFDDAHSALDHVNPITEREIFRLTSRFTLRLDVDVCFRGSMATQENGINSYAHKDSREE